MADYRHLRAEPGDDGRVTVTLARDEHNALDEILIEELRAVADSFAKTSPRAVVLRSAGRSFMVGMDLSVMDRGWDRARQLIRGFQGAVSAWERIDAPTIAVLSGHAIGAGCELALACDWRFMATGRPLIGLPEVKRGIVPAGSGTQRMTRLLGRAAALDMCLRGRLVGAGEAEHMGLVSKAAAAEDLDGAVDDLVAELSELAPLTVSAIKRCIVQGGDAAFADGLAIEEREMVAISQTEDAQEGVRAFLEHRDPRFTGR